jgi:hypothetical protein
VVHNGPTRPTCTDQDACTVAPHAPPVALVCAQRLLSMGSHHASCLFDASHHPFGGLSPVPPSAASLRQSFSRSCSRFPPYSSSRLSTCTAAPALREAAAKCSSRLRALLLLLLLVVGCW